MIQRSMTAEDFSLHRWELPDAGQWAELVRGVPISLQPPDPEHGTIVLNLSKVFSAYVHAEMNGYPCFDLGLHVESAPDTVLHPAVSYFTSGERFSESDKDYTDSVPTLVVELATSNDRRSNINERIALYHRCGVSTVWVVDPDNKTVHILRRAGSGATRLTEFETLHGAPDLKKFQMNVGDLFREPDWA
ncbi:hypothetical protein KOR42_02880 [Thalassoglobus neptunius]|uniref:Putative restriction endonuclease domain-containing protein n=1 Tax=Thalassoglobus neptunius TaxID=1938619 RepID=A0A5C5X467_9PLAN|nr:Uma2 family endonuclease [Thalassoglobus neptunius]TWT56932.1 hypothetical protein KOR42_02880 [Thalassoglobus neptunius]